jgi:hypothetical protein
LSFPVNATASLPERLDFFQNPILLLEHNHVPSLAGQFYSIHPESLGPLTALSLPPADLSLPFAPSYSVSPVREEEIEY